MARCVAQRQRRSHVCPSTWSLVRHGPYRRAFAYRRSNENRCSESLAAPPRSYVYARLSPDGTRVALDVRDEQNDIWVWNLARQTLARITKDPGIDRFPVWSADGTRIAYSSSRGGTIDNVFSQAADGTGESERLIEAQTAHSPQTFTPDGSQLVVREGGGGTGSLKLLSLTGKRAILPLIQPPGVEVNGEISPDGRWLAYQSNESGRVEIFVRPFPNVNSAKFLVSTDGGTHPLWARNGRELFYLTGTRPGGVAVMAVPIQPGATLTAGRPQKLFEGPYLATISTVARPYDVSAGGRFLMIKDPSRDESSGPSSFVILLNFFDELKRLAPRQN
jgi:Tol biopolymer transport system component